MLLARTDHQEGAGLCKLHYFNAIAPCDSRTGSSPKISTKAWPTVNSMNGVIDDTTCRSRTPSSRLYDTCIDVLRLGSVIVDSYDMATANDEVDRAAFFYSHFVGYDYIINTPTHTGVSNQPIQWLFRR